MTEILKYTSKSEALSCSTRHIEVKTKRNLFKLQLDRWLKTFANFNRSMQPQVHCTFHILHSKTNHDRISVAINDLKAYG